MLCRILYLILHVKIELFKRFIIGMFYLDIYSLFLYRLFMVKYKILGSFTGLIKDIILRDTVLSKKYALNHPRTKYTLDDILIDILYVGVFISRHIFFLCFKKEYISNIKKNKNILQ